MWRGRGLATVAPDRAADPEAAREAALVILERTRRTRSDLTRRLEEKGYTTAAIEPALDRLAGVGLIDDVEYARAFLESRWERRTAGFRRLEQELRRRGVSADDVAAGRERLEQARGAVDDAGAALRVIEQVAARYARLEPRVRRQRLYGLLARRGFDGAVIARALGLHEERDTGDPGTD